MNARTQIHRATVAGLTLAAVLVPVATASAKERPAGPRLQAIMDRAVKARAFPGVALYVREPGRRPWSGAAGRANIAAATPMRPGDRFRSGSIMKPFVAAATLQLVEEGAFALDDPLTAVLPERVTARFHEADRITVRMLLNHTSGLAEYTDAGFDREVLANPRRQWTTSELLDRAAARPRVGAPGERFSYANANYNLLGLILEQATGRPWRAVVREHVIRPLHLRHTSLPQPGVVPAGRDIAHGYQLAAGRLRDLTNVDSSMAGAAGGHTMLTTTADLSRFLDALLAGKLFRQARTLKEMLTFVPASDGNGLTGYGLGLERRVLPGVGEMVGHMGTTAGYRAFMFRLPAQGTDLGMVTTSPSDPMPVLAPALKLLAS